MGADDVDRAVAFWSEVFGYDVVRFPDAEDEFTILVPEIQSSHEADAIARKVLDVLKVPIRLTGNELIITTSIGITIGLDWFLLNVLLHSVLARADR